MNEHSFTGEPEALGEWSTRKTEEHNNQAPQLERTNKQWAHYEQGNLSAWDAIAGLGLTYLEGNVVKYVARHRHKGSGDEDLKKALDYVVKLIRWEYKIVDRQELVDIVERHFKE